jgi:hypothetical protein
MSKTNSESCNVPEVRELKDELSHERLNTVSGGLTVRKAGEPPYEYLNIKPAPTN